MIMMQVSTNSPFPLLNHFSRQHTQLLCLDVKPKHTIIWVSSNCLFYLVCFLSCELIQPLIYDLGLALDDMREFDDALEAYEVNVYVFNFKSE